MSEESNYVREKLGAIQSTLSSIEKKLDEGTERMNTHSDRIRKIEDWKLEIISISAFVGFVGGVVSVLIKFVYDYLIKKA